MWRVCAYIKRQSNHSSRGFRERDQPLQLVQLRVNDLYLLLENGAANEDVQQLIDAQAAKHTQQCGSVPARQLIELLAHQAA